MRETGPEVTAAGHCGCTAERRCFGWRTTAGRREPVRRSRRAVRRLIRTVRQCALRRKTKSPPHRTIPQSLYGKSGAALSVTDVGPKQNASLRDAPVRRKQIQTNTKENLLRQDMKRLPQEVFMVSGRILRTENAGSIEPVCFEGALFCFGRFSVIPA